MKESLCGLIMSLLIPAMATFAEERAVPFSPEDLLKQSTLVFKGTISQVETDETAKVSFPVKAKLTSVVKGKSDETELSFKHKSPGKFVIFEEDFNKPELGKKGTFYLQDMGGTLILIGYIKETEPRVGGDAKPEPQRRCSVKKERK